MKTKVYNKLNIRIISVLLALFLAAAVIITLIDLHNIRNIYKKSYTDRLLVSNMMLSELIDEDVVIEYIEMLKEKGEEFEQRQLQYALDRSTLFEMEERGASDAEKEVVLSRMRAFRSEVAELKDENYYQTIQRLCDLRDYSKTKYVYVFANTGLVDEDGNIYYTYIFDAGDTEDQRYDFEVDSDGLGTADTYDDTADWVYETGKQMEEAVFYHEEPYGKLYYVFSPIIKDGKVIAVMATDMDVTEMDGQILDAVITNTAVFSALALVVGAGFYFFVSKQIVTPVVALTLTAEQLAEGDIYSAVSTKSLRSTTEIGALASAIDGIGIVYRDMLTSSSNVLQAASIGQLDVRNAPERFKGGIAKAVGLINAALDATVLYLNGIPESIFIISNTLEIYFRNTEAQKAFGGIGGVELLRRALPDNAAADAGTVSGVFAGLMQNGFYSVNAWFGKACYSFEFREIMLEDDTENSLLIIAVDITALINEKINAQAANRAKSEFLSRVSHELRTPMNVIIGMASLGIRESADPAVLERFRNIDAASRQLLNIINDVLDMSRIESGKMEIRSEVFDPRTLISESAALFDLPAKEKNLSLSVAVDGGVPQRLSGDGLRLKQILVNLVGNAIKFTERGGIDLSADVASETGGQVMLRITVKDTGIGMDAAFLKKIFTPFEQEEIYLQRKSKGTGLGLPICKNLVELMGGEITVASKQGEGSVFTVLLPFETRGDAPARDEPAAAMDTAQNGDTDLSGMRVMVVDDIDINRMIFKEMLSENGLEITEAPDGTDALTLFSQSPEFYYDIIFMDIQMEKMDGYEATRRIRALERGDNNVPIIAMTANALKQDVDDALACGMNGHLAKPVDFDVCIRFMQQYYTKKR